MVSSLHTFLQTPDSHNTPLSRILRDVLLYSYPNAMIRMAARPGGLRAGLPDTLVPPQDFKDVNVKMYDKNKKGSISGADELSPSIESMYPSLQTSGLSDSRSELGDSLSGEEIEDIINNDNNINIDISKQLSQKLPNKYKQKYIKHNCISIIAIRVYSLLWYLLICKLQSNLTMIKVILDKTVLINISVTRRSALCPVPSWRPF